MTDSWLTRLAEAPLRRFADWPDQTLEMGRPGIYAIFADDIFLYAGLSYRDRSETTNPQAQGVWGRLATHARGGEPGQFSDGIRDHFILPELTTEQLRAGFDMKLAIRDFVRSRCTYRALVTTTGDEARRVETDARSVGLASFGPPRFNALRPAGRSEQRTRRGGEQRDHRSHRPDTEQGHRDEPTARVSRPSSAPQAPPPTRYPNPRNDDPWDNDAVHWLLEQPGVAEHFTRGVLFECARRQPRRLQLDAARVGLARQLCRRHGVEQVLVFDVAKGKRIWRLRRTDRDAPAYPDYGASIEQPR